MSILTKESDLLQFIKQKCQNNIDVSNIKIITMYAKLISSSITRTYEKLGLFVYSVTCMETIDNLFWIIFSYSKNLKLTMFLCDRAILLFNEYILMTKNSLFSNDEDSQVNFLEIKTFVYKKTIGPIIFNEKPPEKINNLMINGKIIYNIYYFFLKKIMNESLEDIDLLMNQYIENVTTNIIEKFMKRLNNTKKKKILEILHYLFALNEFSELNIISTYNLIYVIIFLIKKKSSVKEFQNKKLIDSSLKKLLNGIKKDYKNYYIKNDSIKISNELFKFK